MSWLFGALLLLGVGIILRRILTLGAPATSLLAGLPPLTPGLDAVYQPIAQEVETNASILGISLNDAFEERDASHLEIAWHMVQLSSGEWARMAATVTALLNAISKHVARAASLPPDRRIGPEHFKAQVLVGSLRTYELLDRLVFGSQLRFQLRVRLLRGAVEKLTKQFRRTYRYMEQTQDHSPEIWLRYDLYFHDFDLVAKEALLAFRDLLACLPPASLHELTVDTRALVKHGVRACAVHAGR